MTLTLASIPRLALGALAGLDVPHPFEPGGGWSLCWWCLGWRDDTRHWLPPVVQAADDAAVREHEDDRWRL